MARTRALLAAIAAISLAACASPTSNPTAPALAAGSLDAKPSSGTPHTATFSGHLSGSGSVTGAITGSFAATSMRANASGTYVLTVTTVDRGNEQFCTDADLATVRGALGNAGALVNARAGALALSIAQNQADGRSTFTWELKGIAGADGRTWSTGGNSTLNGPATLDPGSSTTSLTISQSDGHIGFSRQIGTTKKADFNTTCRATFTLTLTEP